MHWSYRSILAKIGEAELMITVVIKYFCDYSWGLNFASAKTLVLNTDMKRGSCYGEIGGLEILKVAKKQ